MMRDVDGLNRFYDPLVQLYNDRREADRDSDCYVRPCAYDASAFPIHAIKCPDELQQSVIGQTLTSGFVGSSQAAVAAASRPRVAFSGMNYPIRVIKYEQDPFTATTTVQSASAAIADQCCCPPGWISLGSRFGSLAYALMELNPTMALLPCLIVEED